MNQESGHDLSGIQGSKNLQPDEDSGSIYEASLNDDESVQISDKDEESETQSFRETRSKPSDSSSPAYPGSSVTGALMPGGSDHEIENPNDQIRAEALAWASKFDPADEHQIVTPPRSRYNRRWSRKRKASDSNPNDLKRLKGFYSNGYRELLNNEIQDATTKGESEHHLRIRESQIGSSLWSAAEKDMFFSSLSRMGKGNVRGIAAQIGSKSEVQVQEYIHVLKTSLVDRPTESIDYTDYPIAFEISQECCAMLEQAADWIATSQNRQEELAERTRWGQFWLLDTKACKLLGAQENDGDKIQDATQDIVPAAGLLNLKNWLRLAEGVFMNPGGSLIEDNWTMIAEPGESPAIRATAFEDFYSLAISITKRIVSTVLFCTSSKIRALDSKKLKHAQITAEDVKAAVKILGLKTDWNDYWIHCARRCHLEVYEGASTKNYDDMTFMTYNQVEQQLSHEPVEADNAGHSVRQEREDHSLTAEVESLEADVEESDHDSSTSQDLGEQELSDLDDTLSVHDSDIEFADSWRQRSMQRAKENRAKEKAHDKYVEGFDAEASRLEEQRLWDMLKQTPPPRLKSEEAELPVILKESQQDMDYDFETSDED
ncbi:hypothetical protein F5884DRAFT_804555 [Xylogone sp. PMI_703]|nr:hypothetical protein F5884DRAFT_804555 [Xylogone sp. PMI_703]